MEKRMFKVYAKGDEKIQLKIIPGPVSYTHLTLPTTERV